MLEPIHVTYGVIRFGRSKSKVFWRTDLRDLRSSRMDMLLGYSKLPDLSDDKDVHISGRLQMTGRL